MLTMRGRGGGFYLEYAYFLDDPLGFATTSLSSFISMFPLPAKNVDREQSIEQNAQTLSIGAVISVERALSTNAYGEIAKNAKSKDRHLCHHHYWKRY